MLQKIHEKTKGWIATVILGLVCVVFVLWGVEYYFNGNGAAGKALAKIGNQKITERDIAPLVRQLQQQVAASGGQLTDAVMQQIKAMALQNVMSEYALTEAATRAGFVVSQAQAQQFLMNLPAFQVDGQFSLDKFKQYAYANGLQVPAILSQIQNSLLVEQVMGGVQSSVFTLPSELAYYYNLFYQQRSFNYAIVPAARFIKDVKVTPALMQTYYNNNREALRLPEKVSIEYLLLSPEAIRQSVTVSDAAISAYYQAHPDNYRDGKQQLRPLSAVKDSIRTALLLQKVQNKLAKMSDELSSAVFTTPDSLAPAADALHLKIQSTDFFTAQGASTGVAQNPEVVAAAFSPEVLQQKNNSNLITLKNGDLLVLRVKTYVPTEVPPFNAVEAKIKQQLSLELAQTKAVLLANQLQQALQQGKTPAAVAAPQGLAWVGKTNVKRGAKDVPPALVQAAFNLAQTGSSHATTVALANGDTAVLWLSAIQTANYAALAPSAQEDFKQKIQQMLADLMYQLYMLSVQKSVPAKVYGMK